MGLYNIRIIAWQYIYEKTDLTTNWIRVQTPDAGSSDAVSKNRGFFFIPEIDDQVMIGYELGSPERPFVMGSMFHKNSAGGITGGNDIKSITTRSGAIITFDDSKGDGSVTVTDPSGSTIVLGGDKTISISAPESITMSAKSITITGEDKVEISSKAITGSASENMTLSGTQSMDISSDMSISQTAKQVSIEGTVSAEVKAATLTIEGSLSTSIKGTASLNLN